VESLENRNLLSISVGHMFYGVAPETFVIGNDDQVYAEKFDANGNPAYGYFLTAPLQVKKVEVVQNKLGIAELFAIGMDDQVYGLKLNNYGDPVGDFFLVAAGRVKDLATVPDFFGSSEVFVQGLDDEVYSQRLTDAGDPIGTSYTLTATGQVQQILAGVAQDNNGNIVPELFVIGMNGQVYAQKFTSSGDSAGPYFLTAPGQVQVQQSFQFSFSRPASGLIPELFVTGMDDRVYAQKFTSSGDPIGSYILMSGGQVTSFSVGTTSNDTVHPELLAIGLDGQVYALKTSDTGDPVGDYVLTAPGQVQNITASYVQKNGNYYLELFATGMDDQVYVQQFDVNGNSVGDYFLAAPGGIK
jgi:hypothetical protein